MVPKVRAALAALSWDGAEAIIADGSAPDALVRALTDPTFGTRVSASLKRRRDMSGQHAMTVSGIGMRPSGAS